MVPSRSAGNCVFFSHSVRGDMAPSSGRRNRLRRHRWFHLLVPSSHDRLGQVVLVAEDADARRIENEMRTVFGRRPTQRAASTLRKCALENTSTLPSTSRSAATIRSARAPTSAALSPSGSRRGKAPSRALSQDLLGGQSFIGAIVPLGQVGLLHAGRPKPASPLVLNARCDGLDQTAWNEMPCRRPAILRRRLRRRASAAYRCARCAFPTRSIPSRHAAPG